MSPKFKIHLDFNKLSNLSSNLPKEAASMLGRFSKQLNGYEKKVRGLVKGFDLKSQNVRNQSAKRLDELANQVRKTRTNVEKKVVSIINKEGKSLNKRVSGLVGYLQSLRHLDAPVSKKKNSTTKKTASSKKSSPAKKVSAKKATKTAARSEGIVESRPSA